MPEFAGDKAPSVSWLKDDKHMGLRLRHFKTVTAVEWHRKGDYFSTVMPTGESSTRILSRRQNPIFIMLAKKTERLMTVQNESTIFHGKIHFSSKSHDFIRSYQTKISNFIYLISSNVSYVT
ncbi:hypothetical protein VIGAN_03273000 [Vigna angularis var. angularis]|uniref:Uncharacterized protein n=1 Tax=Vigna angularis var. angularis TaxID=157739 RepID=A0A0S3RQ57_PHAAN|nr:hypothetical protein VIGAN_03273000 [Vigna angularis var. angularis]